MIIVMAIFAGMSVRRYIPRHTRLAVVLLVIVITFATSWFIYPDLYRPPCFGSYTDGGNACDSDLLIRIANVLIFVLPAIILSMVGVIVGVLIERLRKSD